jgi:hypothetical protein
MPPIFTDDPERFLPVMVMVAPVSSLDGDMLLIFGPLPPDPSFFEQDRVTIVNISNKEKENNNAFIDLSLFSF